MMLSKSDAVRAVPSSAARQAVRELNPCSTTFGLETRLPLRSLVRWTHLFLGTATTLPEYPVAPVMNHLEVRPWPPQGRWPIPTVAGRSGPGASIGFHDGAIRLFVTTVVPRAGDSNRDGVRC